MTAVTLKPRETYYNMGKDDSPSGKRAKPAVPTKKPTKKKAKDKPKRPLSAYNFFFKEEREKILKIILRPDGEVAAAVREERESNPGQPAIDVRKLKKEGGKVSFEEMGKLIGQRWKAIGEKRLQKCTSLAAADTSRYKGEMIDYNARQEAKMRSEAAMQKAHPPPPTWGGQGVSSSGPGMPGYPPVAPGPLGQNSPGAYTTGSGPPGNQGPTSYNDRASTGGPYGGGPSSMPPYSAPPPSGYGTNNMDPSGYGMMHQGGGNPGVSSYYAQGQYGYPPMTPSNEGGGGEVPGQQGGFGGSHPEGGYGYPQQQSSSGGVTSGGGAPSGAVSPGMPSSPGSMPPTAHGSNQGMYNGHYNPAMGSGGYGQPSYYGEMPAQQQQAGGHYALPQAADPSASSQSYHPGHPYHQYSYGGGEFSHDGGSGSPNHGGRGGGHWGS